MLLQNICCQGNSVRRLAVKVQYGMVEAGQVPHSRAPLAGPGSASCCEVACGAVRVPNSGCVLACSWMQQHLAIAWSSCRGWEPGMLCVTRQGGNNLQAVWKCLGGDGSDVISAHERWAGCQESEVQKGLPFAWCPSNMATLAEPCCSMIMVIAIIPCMLRVVS